MNFLTVVYIHQYQTILLHLCIVFTPNMKFDGRLAYFDVSYNLQTNLQTNRQTDKQTRKSLQSHIAEVQ